MSAPVFLIRNSAKAIIVRDGRVLLIRTSDQSGDWCVLPGDRQNHQEPLWDTVRRECLEELGVQVQVGELRLVREFIGKNYDDDEGVHQVEFMFECQIAAGAAPSAAKAPDTRQTGIVWVPLAELVDYRLFPTGLVHQRRDGGEVAELAEARALELTESANSDGDRWYTLAALLTDRPNQKPGQRVTIHKTIHDPTEPRNFGLWLARRAAIPCRDLVPDAAARQAEVTKLTDALAATGKFDRWPARRLR
jgi:ADP-ribose pyrophosphatase YjhB (NUDIX family)